MIATLVSAAVMLGLGIAAPYWWWVMIVPFAYGAAGAKTGWRAFWTGFLAAGLLWLGAGTYLYFTGSGLIAARMARMFGLGRPGTMIAATALVAAVAAGIAGYAGYAARAAFKRPAKKDTP
jgi:hypothetical protein